MLDKIAKDFYFTLNKRNKQNNRFCKAKATLFLRKYIYFLCITAISISFCNIDSIARKGSIVKVRIIEDGTGKVVKRNIITKQGLLKDLEEKNKKIGKKHGEMVIPPFINNLPPLPAGVAGVSVKPGQPDYRGESAEPITPQQGIGM